MTEYLLRDGNALERRRLALLERHHDPDTIAALECTGVGAGWTCLDVGAGAGSISRWLQQRGANVLATDLDVSRLEGVHDTRVHDITGDEPIGRTFDLVHTRLLLLHLPERDRVLGRLVALTRRAGWIVVGDIDFTPVRMHAPTPEWERTWAAWCAATQAGGWDLACGARLVTMLEAAGVGDVCAQCSEQEDLPGGSDPLTVLSLALERLRPRLTAHGATDGDVTSVRQALESADHTFDGPATWTAWGRRPSGMAAAYQEWAQRHPWTATLAGAAISTAPLGAALAVSGVEPLYAWSAAGWSFAVVVAILRLSSWRAGRPILPRLFGG